MLTKIDALIAEYQQQADELEEEVDELLDRMNGEFDPRDASGGNFDDAYAMGDEDGDIYATYREIKRFIEKLEALKEGE